MGQPGAPGPAAHHQHLQRRVRQGSSLLALPSAVARPFHSPNHNNPSRAVTTAYPSCLWIGCCTSSRHLVTLYRYISSTDFSIVYNIFHPWDPQRGSCACFGSFRGSLSIMLSRWPMSLLGAQVWDPRLWYAGGSGTGGGDGRMGRRDESAVTLQVSFVSFPQLPPSKTLYSSCSGIV